MKLLLRIANAGLLLVLIGTSLLKVDNNMLCVVASYIGAILLVVETKPLFRKLFEGGLN
jgi:membrane-bound ClpP family serine protease